ncbi:transcription initiation factor IIB family protein [Natronorubrum sulfidifaciens]|uniref:Transcription initiation factor IIB n=1 Tax=Natronorubrum sulfidifaciens JCM 14089 TaxID=1230460 RepID=L9WBD6_9EURY|nr:transcription initiation factor IIB [Natronorubrum sulfidifaciens]ELY46672.1 transcription initiation factor IIB [Natronorubrum sulfidifaciens JCM 14089]
MRAALSPVTHIEAIAIKVGASYDTQTIAYRIAQDCEDDPATWGRAPRSVGAAALYVAAQLCDEHITQQEIADAAGIARGTIRDNYPPIAEHAEEMESINVECVEVPAQ